MSRTWLVQMPADVIDDLTRSGLDDFWPAVDGRSSHSVQEGDHVVLWQMGSGADAGAVGLGIFTGQPRHIPRPVSHQRPDGPTRPRRCWQVRFTHWFPGEMVRRTELAQDPRFQGFLLFRRGGAQGANVKAVDAAQRQAILDRTPWWAPVTSPTHLYAVQLRIPTTEASDQDACRQAHRQLAADDPRAISVQVWAVGSTTDEDDVAEVSAPSTSSAWVVWTHEARGRTALEALEVTLDLGGRTALPAAADLRVERRPRTEPARR